MPRLLRSPASAGAQPGPGRSSAGLTALRGLHLDSASAPAITWQLEEAGQKQDQPNQSVHAFRGTASAAIAGASSVSSS